MNNFLIKLTAGLTCMLCIMSCTSTRSLHTYGVGYQSIRMDAPQITKIPADAKIVVGTTLSTQGDILVQIKNNTKEIMIIDQTLSFVVNTDGVSTSYYDPTIRTSTVTDFSSGTKGASVNLGSVANLLGVGGKIGSLLSGINVGGSNTNGQSVANTTYFADQPQIALAPMATGAMSKVFKINNIGVPGLQITSPVNYQIKNIKEAPLKFSVCISYSIDNGNTFDKIVTDFYVNSLIYVPTASTQNLNDAVRNILTSKSDAITEPWGLFYFNTNFEVINNKLGSSCEFVNYK